MARLPSEFARSWWAQRWLSPLDMLGDAFQTRIRQGRSIAQNGGVSDLAVRPGVIEGEIRDSYWDVRQARIVVSELDERVWAGVIEALASEALTVAKLFAGEAPPQLEDLFVREGGSLFTPRPEEIRSVCTCNDAMHPCKHVIGLHYTLAADLENDPFLLFTLRGRPAESVIQGVRARWSAELTGESVETALQEETEAPPPTEPETNPEPEAPIIPLRAAGFFTPHADLDSFVASPVGPQAEWTLLRTLGQPPFTSERENVETILSPVYELVSRRALHAFAVNARKRKKS